MGTDHQVGIIGGGSWGTALAHLFGIAGANPLLYVRREEQANEINKKRTNERYLKGYAIHGDVIATTDLKRVATSAGYLVVVVPSSSLRKVAYELGNYVRGDQVLLSATKGLEPKTFHRMSEILRQETCAKKIGALSGPNLAKELMDEQPAGTVIASPYREVVSRGATLLRSSVMRVYGSTDVIGVELAGALKNILAICSGIASGLGLGDNARSTLITRGLAEIGRLGVKAGASPLTFKGLAGVGDVIATCSSPLSRNHRVGRGLASGKSVDEVLESMVEVAEGVNTTRVARAYARELGVEMPITESLYRVLYERESPKDMIEELMRRKVVYEIDRAPIEEPVS